MTNLYDIIIRPALTEKTTQLAEHNQYVFRVDRKANKYQIRQAVEKIFGVDVVKVNTLVMPSKPKRVGRSLGRRAAFKKAIVTVADGQTIDLYALEGTEAGGEV
ncbi:50S ribosomal protein L23 [Lujinxingia vulgaris]|uniref:Large ribosomal subunit protein uL23 n=2 Tax=Lujinxingia TaxID=2653226 RepID=A0A5C6XDD1_9DELT|nr:MULTISPECIES: 50S ribosomal protein L23 [Lujinxingia]RVU42252.1 50S ribosomal protein L23 [Lujinxingia sediminis]TXD35099.1 50S ribosomal protein L23 [Lujinxingia vulgaris]TXD35412.1 50S ribosomal protein L23 [Lujinxingia vulgaris]